jgi:16S rRNA (guanine(966)-N(2))-methyltransferase RsmD
VRVTTGAWGGRRLKTLEGADTRPTEERVRMAVFNRLGPYFTGGAMLDLFSGSGAMALEGLSRGLEQATAVEAARPAAAVIRANGEALGAGERLELLVLPWEKALKQLAGQHRQYDLIYSDPPYGRLLASAVAQAVADLGLLKPDGDLVLEMGGREEVITPDGLKWEKSADYGRTRLVYLKKGGTGA